MLGFTKRKLLSDRKALGRWGEKRSEKYLKRRGLKTLTRNYTCKTGEIDLIMADADGTIVFVEVKTRKSDDFTDTEDVVTWPKRQRMAKTARFFLRENKIEDRPCRFDIVTVNLDKTKGEMIKHYPDAFLP